MSDAPTLPAPVRPTPDAGDRRAVVVAVAIAVAVLSFVGVFLLWRVFVETLADTTPGRRSTLSTTSR